MDVIYSLIPGMIFFGLVFVGVLIWAIKRGQYEDLEGDATRILMDDDEEENNNLEPGERRKRVGLNFPDDD